MIEKTREGCPACGSALETFDEDGVIGARCTACDYSLVATSIKPIDEDPVRYDLYLAATPVPDPKVETLRFVAARTGMSFIQAKDAICDGALIEKKLYAPDALGRIREFEAKGIAVRAEPPFPWIDETTRAEGR